MNEFSLIMAKLTQYSLNIYNNVQKDIGASSEELFKILGYSGKYAKERLLEKLVQFSEYLTPIGLNLRLNPLNQKWFLGSNQDNMEFLQKNPFELYPRLGATLYVILALFLLQNKDISLESVKKYRKKKDISEDIKELERLNFIIVHENRIQIDNNLGYMIDFQQFLKALEKLNPLANSSPID